MAGFLGATPFALAQQTTAAPAKGEVVIASVDVTGTVSKIDQKTRKVTIKPKDGKKVTFVADPAVANLAQVKKGDVVTATYTEALAYEVKKGGKAGVDASVAAAAAPLGAKPAGAAAQSVTVTVKVTAIDQKVPSITFKGPDGDTQTVKVQAPEKLQGVKAGDTVALTYSEAVSIKIENPAKK
jgi:Cu/Ag efflux protein CusF